MNYRDFLKIKKQPVNYLPLILDLQQSLTTDSQKESKAIVEELKKVAIQERTHALEEYLLYVLSHLMYIQGEEQIVEFTYNDVVFNLRKIWTYNHRLSNIPLGAPGNRLNGDGYYIAHDAWRSHFDAVVDAAEEMGSEACFNNECRGWSGEYDRELLWQETEKILGFTYLEDESKIAPALRSHWSDRTFAEY